MQMLDKLNTKLAEIRAQKERVTANFNALVGAEQMLLQLIEEETSTESEAIDNATDND
jgi:ribosomal protein L16 Arg81 hydroxylase